MSGAVAPAVVVDTMVVSSIIHGAREPSLAASYRSLIDSRPVVVSFVTVTELRYGALKAGWGDLRRRGLERDLAQLVIVQPDDELMQVCAELRSSSELAGHPLGQKVHEADRWIASTALALDTELVSDDTAFRDVPRLTVLSRPT